jgi:hypothetical protein
VVILKVLLVWLLAVVSCLFAVGATVASTAVHAHDASAPSRVDLRVGTASPRASHLAIDLQQRPLARPTDDGARLRPRSRCQPLVGGSSLKMG